MAKSQRTVVSFAAKCRLVNKEVVCSEQLVTGDDENTQIRLKYKYKHTQKDNKCPKSCFGSDIASQQGFGEKIRVKRVLKKKN